jgi:hypothetical protein
VSDLVIPIWVALSTTGIILLSIFQKPSFVTIVLILDLTGRITLLAGYRLLKTYILPISTYGLEIVIPKGKILDDIQNYYKKL